MSCANNVKQLGLATNGINDAQNGVPPVAAPDGWTPTTLAGTAYNGAPYTFFTWLLPHIEQDAIFRASTRGPAPPGAYCGGQYMRPVKTYLCPSDPSVSNGLSQTTSGGASGFAVSCYGANYLVFGDPTATGGDYYAVQGKASFPKSIPDGMSNTVIFGEVYGSCSLSTDPGNGASAASLWADSTLPWRPIICHNTPSKNVNPGYAPCFTFQVRPNPFGGCDPSRAQTSHTGGMVAGLADGSVRFVSPSVSPATWASACDPRDGIPLGSDW